MSFLPLGLEIPRYQHTKVRFLEREHGIEYLPFEFEQMERFHTAKHLEGKIEITGYVSWSRPPYFLLLAAKTTPNCYIVCKTGNEISYPSMNQFSSITGKWVYEIIRDKLQKILLVENVQESSPDFGKIKPHISYNDFIGSIFENWRNIGETTQKLIAQRMVSSPTIPQERAGGLTLTLANYSKKGTVKRFVNDLEKFIPSEIAKQKSLSFEIEELGIKSALPDLGCSSHIAHLANIPKSIDVKLDRMPYSNDEYAVTLIEETMGVLDFDARGLIKSDYPITIEQEIEKKSNDYDVSLDVCKYLLATDVCSPIVSFDVYQKSLDFGRTKLLDFVKDHEDFVQLTGHDQFLDLGVKGKPLSIHNLTVSFMRSVTGDFVSLDNVKDATNFYLDNLRYVVNVQEDLGYHKIPPASTMSVEERRIYVYISNHQKVSINELVQNVNLVTKDIELIVNTLLHKHLLYEPEVGCYSAVPIDV